jgi:hypothetical protein
MSTLSIHTPRTASTTDVTSDVDARFDALVRTAVPAQRSAPAVNFETVFDLDYGQPVDELTILPASAVRVARTARRARVATQPQRSVPRHVRMTRRGRIVAVLVFVSIALGVMTALGGWATASLSGGTPERVRVVEVQPGDTLYDIAADIAQPGDIRSMVHRIQELNSLPGASITEGQKLAVPRG